MLQNRAHHLNETWPYQEVGDWTYDEGMLLEKWLLSETMSTVGQKKKAEAPLVKSALKSEWG